MTKNGKILFYNESDGKGIIITSDKNKVEFSVTEWSDFDTMPHLGLEITFNLDNNQAKDIIVNTDDTTQNQTEETTESINQEDINTPVESDNNNEEVLNNNINDLKELSEENDETVSQSDTVDNEEDSEDTTEEAKNLEESDNSEEIDEDLPDEAPRNVKEDAKRYIDEYNQRMEAEEALKAENEAIEKAIEEERKQAEYEEEQRAKEEEKRELEEQRSSITITLNISTAVSNYFNNIDHHIKKRTAYKKVEGKLDYVLAKRFLNTTFNNLIDIDLHIVTPKIKALNDDLKEMGGVYEDFINKTRNPHLAYKEVFLACQSEYLKVKDGAEYTIDKLKQLRVNEESMGGMLKVKKDDLSKNINTPEFEALKDELKSLNGAYVDVVHMMAELDERYKHDMELLQTFEEEYREDFYEIFEVEAIKYKNKILEILNAQAYIFDAQMWREAKNSKAVKAHFEKSDITGDMTTKTYLKYYLDTLNTEKISTEAKKLFDLYKKLEEENPEYTLIVMNSPQDIMEYETSLKQACKTMHTKSFIDEKSALVWATKNSVKIIIIEDRLQRTTAERFLHVYQKNIFLRPNIIVLGEKPKACPYSINKVLSKNVSARILIDSVKELLK